MKKIILFLCLILPFAPLFAQNIHEIAQEETNAPAQTQPQTGEAGLYQRRSISLLNVLGHRNHTLQNSRWVDIMVRTIQDSVRMARFDYNAVNPGIVAQFQEMPSNMSIEARMNATVVPAVLAVLEAQREVRAAAMLTEQQRNSFMVNKARELGITEAELNAVMNSAYIFLPVYGGHQTARNNNGETVITLTAGGYWWRIDNGGEKPSVVIISRIMTTATGIHADRNAAFASAVNSIAAEVQVATRAIADFQLTAQIISRSPRHVEISIGKSEGVALDDKYRIYESREDAHGNVTQRRRGWVMINRVDTLALESSSRAQVISGVPYIGAVVKEVPTLPFDVTFAFTRAPFSMRHKKSAGALTPSGGELGFSDVKVSGMYGPKLKISMNLANMARKTEGISQLWLNLSGEYLFGATRGDYYQNAKFNGSESYGGDFSVSKKWYVRRFAVAPEAGLGLRKNVLKTATNSLGTQWGFAQWSLGGFSNVGLEFALAPVVNIGAEAGYKLFTGGNLWTLSRRTRDGDWESIGRSRSSGDYRLRATGAAFSVYLTMAIPSNFDFLRSMLP